MKSRIIILFLLFLSPLLAQVWEGQSKIVPAYRYQNTNFGSGVDIDGNYAVVGARWDDYDANNEDRDFDAGAVYVYKLEAGDWVQKQKLVASDRDTWDQFGSTVVISGDYIVVGSPYDNLRDDGELSSQAAGAAYVFWNNGSEWVQVQKLTASNRATLDYFGSNVNIDGDHIIISANGTSTAEDGGSFIAQAGAVYIFEKRNELWEEMQKIVAPIRRYDEYFGTQVAVRGKFAFISSVREDLDENGENHMENAGAVFVYYKNGSEWTLRQRLVASDRTVEDRFGRGMAVSDNYLMVSAYYNDTDHMGLDTLDNAGSAYIFKKEGLNWVEQQKIVHFDREEYNYLGTNCDITENYALIGSYTKDKHLINGTMERCTGAAYMFKREGDKWVQTQKLVAFQQNEEDRFAYDVALTDYHAIAGAMKEDEDENEENFMANCGSAYIFKLNRLKQVELPVDYSFDLLYPNPSNTSVHFNYESLISTDIKISIYNMKGELVRYFSPGPRSRGYYTISWDGLDQYGKHVPSGVYICSMKSNWSTQIKKMVLLK